MDILSVLGIIIAIGSIVGGQQLEGGHLSSILQFTAFLIVMGGTLGAVMLQFPLSIFMKSLGAARYGLWQRDGGYERGDYPGRGVI
jgi:chemotaxis protein MotA